MCKAITKKGKRCQNKAIRYTDYCHMAIHKAQGGMGIFTSPIPGLEDFGPISDSACPTGNIKETIAHIRAKIATNKENN